jgi:hypothetical protein
VRAFTVRVALGGSNVRAFTVRVASIGARRMIPGVERRLETGLLTTVTGGVVAVVVAAAEWLRSIVNPAPTPGILMFTLAVGVLLLTGVTVALVFAVTARLVSLASGLHEGFWHDAGLFLQDFALWLTMWAVFWGVPFVVAMVLAGVLTKYLLTLPAVVVGTAVGLLLLFFFKRHFSPQTWTVLDRFWPARRIGGFWMIVGVLLLTLPGRLLLERCYTFDVAGASGIQRQGAIVPVEVKLSGRLVNHDALRLQVAPMRPAEAKPLQTLEFDVAEPGTYVTWLNLSTLQPGVYRVRIFFDMSKTSGFAGSLTRSPSIFAPPERRFLMRVEKNDRLTSR